MPDVCLTVPKRFTHPCAPDHRGLAAWLREGDAPGEPWNGQTYGFSSWGWCPKINRGERVYVVCEDRLVGYAPLLHLIFDGDIIGTIFPARVQSDMVLVRGGGAVACTVPQKIVGFRGWRYRWWDRSIETPIDLSAWMPAREAREASCRLDGQTQSMEGGPTS